MNNKKQAELAGFVGVKPNTVSDWVNNGNSPKEHHIYRIAEYFGISVGELFGEPPPQAILLHGGGGDKISQEYIDIIESTTVPLLKEVICGRVEKLTEKDDLLKVDKFMDWMEFPK